MFKKVGVDAIITSSLSEISSATKLLLPGVGSFDYGISSLRKAPFFEMMEKEVLENKKPILGICLGMQLLTKSSEEGKEKGLGWINAETVKFNLSDSKLSIPHMGWNEVIPKQTNDLFQNLLDNRFYFVHSYHVKCEDELIVSAISNYGREFTCGVKQGNIMGVQFHPEKSHKFGKQLLLNFSNITC